ncbi:DNA replication regulator DPB11, partial [Phenoliferia sp. Uapishka_3]
MGFKTFGGGGGGGKKGPQKRNGSHKNRGTLRPQPVQPFQDATKQPTTKGSKGKGLADDTFAEDANLEEYGEDADDEEEFGYDQDVRGEAKPLARAIISVTGCSDVKVSLLETAAELGGVTDTSLTEKVTHLIADHSGTEKFDVAVKYGMRIMSRHWIPAVRDAWMNAEPTNFEELEDAHRLPPFASLVVSLTGFAQGEYKNRLIERLADNGASVTASVEADTTHIIVAFPTSPHSQDNVKKLTQVQEARYSKVKTVWEGWVDEVIEFGGVRSNREKTWAWVPGKGEPTQEELREVDMRKKAKNPKSQASDELRDSLGWEDSAGRRGEPQDEAAELASVAKARKSRAGNKVASQVDGLINDFFGGAGSATPPLPSTSMLPLQIRSLGRAIGSDAELFGAPPVSKSTGKSVIQSLATRSLFNSQTRNHTISLIPGGSRSAATATEADDSAFFDNVDDNVVVKPVGGWLEDPIFEGKTIVLMGLRERASVVREAITSRAGRVFIDERDDDADWIVVPVFGAPEKYLNSDDPRVVTHLWIETCIFELKFVPPTDRLSERPLSCKVPLPWGSTLNINTSGYEEAGKTHIKYIVMQLGGTFSDTFARTRSHLIHSAIDEGREPDGVKVAKACEWGIPVVGSKWLRDWVQEQEDKQQEELRRKSIARKGKGRETEAGQFSKRTQPLPLRLTKSTFCSKADSDSEQSRTPVADDDTAPLEGCVVLLSSKMKSSDKTTLYAIVETLGGKVLSKFSSDVTHFIHAGTRANESFKEFKTRPDGLEIVHPQWVEECRKCQRRVSENDFPSLYDPRKGRQLAGMVCSPPRASRQSSVRANSRAPSSAPTTHMPPPPLPHRRSSRGSTSSITPLETSMEVEQESPHPLVDNAVEFRSVGVVAEDESMTNSQSEHLSPPRSRQPTQDFSPPITNAAKVQVDPATSSSPAPLPEISNPDTSSDPPEGMESHSKRSGPNVLLKEQTSALLLSLENAPIEDPAAKRKARVGRKRSNGDSLPGSAHSDHIVLPPASNVPRRLPGVGIEPTQFSQTEEYSLDVTFEDPAALRARQQILAALSNGPFENDTSKTPARRKRSSAMEDEETGKDGSAVVEEQQPKKRKTPARNAKHR